MAGASSQVMRIQSESVRRAAVAFASHAAFCSGERRSWIVAVAPMVAGLPATLAALGGEGLAGGEGAAALGHLGIGAAVGAVDGGDLIKQRGGVSVAALPLGDDCTKAGHLSGGVAGVEFGLSGVRHEERMCPALNIVNTKSAQNKHPVEKLNRATPGAAQEDPAP